MERSIQNKVVVVTGGASGIGLNIVDNFVKNGAKIVIIIDINEELGNKAVQDIKGRYGNEKAVFYKCDVTLDLENIFHCICSKYGNIDCLVNNAGIVYEKSIRKTININVIALMEWTIKFYDYMRKDRNGNGGTIINIASVYGLMAGPFLSTYHASKFAVIGFTKSIGHEYNFKKSGVRVVAICPGFTYTQLTENIRPRDDDAMEDYLKVEESVEWQEVDSVGEGTKTVFEEADSGTAWVIQGSRPPVNSETIKF